MRDPHHCIKHESDSPPATIPLALLVCPYWPDIVVYSEELKTVSLLELTSPFNSHTDLTAVHQHKEGKPEYQQIVAEFDGLGFVSQCYMAETGCLGHYLDKTISAIKKSFKIKFYPTPKQYLIEQQQLLSLRPREYSCSQQSNLD